MNLEQKIIAHIFHKCIKSLMKKGKEYEINFILG